MRHKITLLTAAVLLTFLVGATPRAFSQTFQAQRASTIILAGNGTDPVHTLTISVASLGGASTLTLPGGNTAGVLTNPGNGLLTWSPLGIANIAPGTANQFLVTNNAGTPAVQWIGLNINSTDLTGNGIGTALDIASTYPGGTSITTLGTIATGTWAGMTIAVNHGGTGAVTLTSGDLLLGNGASPVTAGPAWSAGTLTGNVSGSALSFTGNLVGDVTGTQGATKINNTSAAGADVIAALTANAGTLTNNTSGSAASFTGSLVGDVTGTQGATKINNTSAAGADVIAALTANTGTLTNNTSGSAASFTGSLAGDVSGPQGTTVIGANKVSYSKMQAVSTTSRLLGSSSTTTPVQEISLGAGLSISGTVLNTVSSGSVTSGTLVNNGAVYATGASAIASTAQMTAGQLLIGSGTSSVPLLGTITTSGSGITATYTSPNIVLANTGVTSLSGGTTGLTDGTGTGAVTLTGTLISTNGGTGVSNPTAHDLLVAEGATAMTPISGTAGTVLIGNGSSADPSFSATPTLGVAGTTAGTLTLASGAAAFSTTVQTSATTPASTYIYQLPAQPTGLPTAGNVLTIGTPTGTGPYTVPLSWSAPNSTTGVLYDQTTEQATVPISSTPATPSFLFNVGYNNTVVADSAAGAIINSINTNTTAANAPLHNADGFTVNVTATGSGTFYGNATGLIVNATSPVGGIPTGVAVTIGGDTIGPAFQLHNKTQGSFYGARSIISTVDSDLEFKETGDKYGTSILDIQNRTGSNGALFQTISNAADTGTDVIDWGFIPGNGTQSNIRLEARHKWAVGVYGANEYLRSSANITAASPEEFQYFFGTTGAAPLYTLSIGENATLLERGNFGIGYGTNSPGGDTANGSPRVRLDVHSPGTYYGNLSDVGYSGASNILLSDTGTSSITAPFVGAMEFQGTNDGISSFMAGAEASRYINYTWPTLSTAPTANQVLSISTISGSGTLATPYLAQLTWATASGSSTGVNYNVATGSPQNTATTTNDLFNVAYTAASGTSATLPGAVITANASGATTTGVATGLSITTTGKGTSGTATGLNLTTTGASTASNNIDISGTNNNWTISALGEITFGTAGTSSAPNITSTAGTAMYVQAGTSTTTNAAGPAVTLQAGTGNGTGIGGGLELWGGTPGATSGNAAGGFASLDGANSADGIGGADSVNAGNGGTNGAGGTVYVAAGNGAGVGVGGAVLVTGGIGGSTGAGGAATIQAGTGGTAGAGGLTTIEGGNGAGTSQAAGGLTLNGGRSTGTASGSTITFQAAPAGGTSNAALNSLIAAATMSATSTTAAQLEIGNTNGGASGISGSLILANTGHQDSTIIQPSATTPALNYTYQLPAQTVAAQPSSGYVLTAGTPTGTSPNYTIPLSWSLVSGSSTGVNYNVATGSPQVTATSTNYLFDVAYANTTSNNNAIGALINSATSTGNGNATGLTIDASTHNAEIATGLVFDVTGGATNTDISGTAGWSVSSAGAGTFSSMNLGTGALNTVGNITIDGSAARTITVNAPSGTGSGVGLTITGAAAHTTGAGGGVSITGGAAAGTTQAGSSITLTPGAPTGTGAVGSIVAAGHVVATGTVPSVGNTGATIQTNSSDFAGLVTSTGTGATTSQTVTFANGFANAPYVMVVAENSAAAKAFAGFNNGVYVTSTATTFTVNFPAGLTAGAYYYMVVGNQ